jgi:hypothetical protein
VANGNETIVPAASQADADGRAVADASVGAAGSRLGRAIGATGDPRRRKWLLALLLVAGWLVQAGLRAWFSRAQVVPLDNTDETAYLVAARFLAGGAGADFSGATLYQGGYPLLITPVYWFTSNPAAVYHAALLVNAVISATVMPLGYLACRRLGLGRPAAYGVAMVAALLPAALFYSEYAITDAIFPVVTLAWLLATHSWLVAASPRARYTAAIGAAALSGYAYAVHSRGEVLVAGFVVVGIFVAWRRPVARGSVAAAAVTVAVTVGAGWALDRYLASALYPEGKNSLTGHSKSTLESVYGSIHVLEMAGGQLWRLVLDSWGIAGIGLVAAVAVAVRGSWGGARPGAARPAVPTDLRVMAALAVGITVGIAAAASAALGPNQPLTWASARYLDGMIVVFFLVGAVVLVRAAARLVLASAACVAVLALVAAVTVSVYAGTSLPTGRGRTFIDGVPGVLTQDWSRAGVLAATAVALALLVVWVLFALLAHRLRFMACVLGAAAAAVSLVAVTQLTAHTSQADGVVAKAMGIQQLAAASGLQPGERVAVAFDISGVMRIAQAFEVPSTQVQAFNPYCQPPPADATVIDLGWPEGRPAQASWSYAPAGWRVVAANRFGGWVVWRKSPGAAAPGLAKINQCASRHEQVSIAGPIPGNHI